MPKRWTKIFPSWTLIHHSFCGHTKYYSFCYLQKLRLTKSEIPGISIMIIKLHVRHHQFLHNIHLKYFLITKVTLCSVGCLFRYGVFILFYSISFSFIQSISFVEKQRLITVSCGKICVKHVSVVDWIFDVSGRWIWGVSFYKFKLKPPSVGEEIY